MGRGGDRDSPSDSPKEVLINDTLYDVSDFKHPGGSVIKFLTNGGDATEAYVEFHGRSKKAGLMLKALLHRLAPEEVVKTRGFNGNEARSKYYATLRTQLEREGFFDPAPDHVAYRVAEVVAMHALGAWLFTSGSAGPIQAVGPARAAMSYADVRNL